MNDKNGVAAQALPPQVVQDGLQTSLDDLLLLIGRLTAENHVLRRELARAQAVPRG